MDPYVGEIRTFGGNFAPVGWLPCDGRSLPISQYTTLFTLIGTTYGGDGQTTFKIPDLRGRAPLHRQLSPGYPLGALGGTEEVALVQAQMPAHTHTVAASNLAGSADSPNGGIFASPQLAGSSPPVPLKLYSSTTDGTMAAQAVQSSGGGQPHANMMPFLAVTFIIAVEGIFPSSN